MRRRFIGGGTLDVFNINDYCTIEALDTNVSVLFTNDIEYGIDGVGWKLLKKTAIVKIQSGQCISFRGNLVPTLSSGIGSFRVNGSFNLKGNIMSLLYGDDAIHNFSLLEKSYAFLHLFYNNDGLKSVSSDFLPATALAYSCYERMFYGCTNLTTAPELPATMLANHCYERMFQGCTSLTTAPKLPATTLADNCYAGMFQGCTSLTTAPEIPATTLKLYCYEGMFADCTSLATAPELPAPTLAYSCYKGMFLRCSKLNYIKMLATDISVSYCLNNWVKGVASTGIFVKNPAMNSLPTATSDNDYAGIPEGWTVVNDGEESEGGGGKIVNHGVLKSVSNTKYIIYWEYPVESGITTVVVCVSSFGTSKQNVITSIGEDVSRNNCVLGPGESLSHIESVTPTEDDTYIYEVTIE